MPSKPIMEEDVLIKGSSSGILIVLNLEQDFEKLTKKLVQKIKKEKKFLSETKLFIKGLDRLLDKDELGMVRKMVRDKTGLELFSPEPDSLPLEAEEKIQTALSQTEYVACTLRAGENRTANADLLIFGDVNGGASVSSTGSIYVYGKIRGTVEAGINGSKSAVIASLGFSPILCKIAGIELSQDINHQELSLTPCFLCLEENTVKLTVIKKD